MVQTLAQYQVFKGEDGKWYWRLVAKNGKIVAVGGEGFSRPSGAESSIKRTREAAQTSAITKVVSE